MSLSLRVALRPNDGSGAPSASSARHQRGGRGERPAGLAEPGAEPQGIRDRGEPEAARHRRLDRRAACTRRRRPCFRVRLRRPARSRAHARPPFVPSAAWRSIEATAIRRHRKLIGAHYRNELARRLEALGYETVPVMIGPVPGFELASYDREVREAFSKRRFGVRGGRRVVASLPVERSGGRRSTGRGSRRVASQPIRSPAPDGIGADAGGLRPEPVRRRLPAPGQERPGAFSGCGPAAMRCRISSVCPHRRFDGAVDKGPGPAARAGCAARYLVLSRDHGMTGTGARA